MQLAALMPFAALCLCACKGPALHLHNPEQHPVFVDGTAETRETLPFRSRLASPPAEASGISVRFFNRRDAQSDIL